MDNIPGLSFSISATSRPPRKNEKHGRDYYFLSPSEFREKINNNEFLEWEEVYEGLYYGTLTSEVERIAANRQVAVFDVDVVGGTNIKKQFGGNALALFIKAPSLNSIEQRLKQRGTDSEEIIRQRVEKAEKELGYARFFDKIIVNDRLEDACIEAETIVKDFIEK